MKNITMVMLFFSTAWGYSQVTCEDATEFYEDFDNDTAPLNPQHVPACWDRWITPDTPAISRIKDQDGSKRLHLNSNTESKNTAGLPAPSYALATMPSVSNLHAGNHRLRFKAYGTDANKNDGKWLEVGYYDAAGIFVLGQKFENLRTTAATMQEYSVNPATWTPAIPATVKRLVFRNSNNTLADLYIDNVIWEPIPAVCAVDVKSPMTVKQITHNTAVFTWTAGGSETAWQYVYVPAATANPFAVTGTDVSGTPTASISGLSPLTSYKVWIRSKCTDGVGSWIGPLFFTTNCVPTTEVLENFDAQTTVPACWIKVGSVGNMGTSDSSNPPAPSGARYLQLSGGYNTPGASYFPFTIASLPPLNNAGAGTHRLKFKASISTPTVDISGTQLVIGWVSDVSNVDTFHELATITNLTKTEFTSFQYTFGTVPQSAYLVFKNPGTIATNFIKIDDVVWEAIPTCTDISGVAVEMVNSTSASLSWTKGGKETAWQYVMTSGSETDPSKLSILDVPAPMVMDTSVEAVFTGLNPNTSYKMWLRPKCESTIFGSWKEPILIKTTCSPVSNFTANFDSAGNLPACWSNAGSIYVTVGGMADAPSSPNILSLQATPTAAAAVAMPAVININTGTQKLSFKYMSSVADAKLDVGYLKNPADAKSFVSMLIEPYRCTAAFQSASISFGTDAVPEGIEVLAFKVVGVASIKIDDVTWIPASGIVPPINDEAQQATILTVGNVFGDNSMVQSNVGATTSIQPTPGCGGYNGADMWNAAVVPASGNITFEINTFPGGLTNTAGAVYSGALNSLTLVQCNDAGSTAGDNHPKISLSGRTPGETLYFRVWENGGNATGSFLVSAYAPGTLGTDAFETNNFAFYPNPVRDVLNLSLNQDITNVAVLNLLGQQVINQFSNGNQVKVDMSDLSRGAYLVKVTAGDQSKSIKVIKE